MKKLRNCILALLIGCCTPLLIWVGVGISLYHSPKRTKLREKALPNWACSVDSDCPPGFVCVGGYCVPDEAH